MAAADTECECPPNNEENCADIFELAVTLAPKEPIPTLPTFLTRVLYTVQTLQQRLRRGVAIAEICCFMATNFRVGGDIFSRVETTVIQALADGFLAERAGKYRLLAPLVRVQQAPVDTRKQLVRDMEKVYMFKTNARKTQQKTKQRCKSPDKQKKQSKQESNNIGREEICQVLEYIRDVLFEQLQSASKGRCLHEDEKKDEKKNCRRPKLVSSDMRLTLGSVANSSRESSACNVAKRKRKRSPSRGESCKNKRKQRKTNNEKVSCGRQRKRSRCKKEQPNSKKRCSKRAKSPHNRKY